jgi:hypothetical protein
MSSVSLSGVNVAVLASCGAGAPVGTPFFWMKPKLTGSSQLGSNALFLHLPAL